MNAWAGIGMVALLLALVLGGLGFLRRTPSAPGPEMSRKAVHISLGLVCLSFPWLFHAAWPVVVLCVLSVAVLGLLRTRRKGAGSVLHAVGRPSLGDIYFPLAVTLLFLLHRDPVIDYLIPILVLTLADAVGALIGVRYGTSRFSTEDGVKSVEGSVAFLVTAFLSTHIPLLLWTETGRLESLLISAVIGLLIMLVEAISWRGLDNLLVPLGVYLLLNVYLEMGAWELTARIAAIGILGIFFAVVGRRSYAREGTLLAGLLGLYLIWGLGGWLWALPPLVLAAGYSLLCPRHPEEWKDRHGLADLGAVTGAGLFWLFAAFAFDKPLLGLAFALSWAAQFGILFASYMAWRSPERSTLHVAAMGGGASALLFVLPVFLLAGSAAPALTALLLVAAPALAASWLWIGEWRRRRTTLDPGRPWRQMACGLGCSALGLLAFLPLVS